MVWHRSGSGSSSLESGTVPTGAEAVSQLSSIALLDAVWRPRRGMLEGRYFADTQEAAAREFAEEAARLRLVGYRPSSVSWSAQAAIRWRRPWHRKHRPGILVVTYQAPAELVAGRAR